MFLHMIREMRIHIMAIITIYEEENPSVSPHDKENAHSYYGYHNNEEEKSRGLKYKGLIIQRLNIHI